MAEGGSTEGIEGVQCQEEKHRKGKGWLKARLRSCCPGGRLPPCPAAVTLQRTLQRESFFEPGPALVLAALGEDNWTGKWKMSEDAKHVLHDRIDRFLAGERAYEVPPLIDAVPRRVYAGSDAKLEHAGDVEEADSRRPATSTTSKETTGKLTVTPKETAGGRLGTSKETTGGRCVTTVNTTTKHDRQVTMKEISAFIDDPDNTKYVQTLPNSVHGLLNYRQVEEAFADMDQDKDETLSPEEFSLFLERLERRHLNFLLRNAHVSFRAFYGRGQPWELDYKFISCQALREELKLKEPSAAPEEHAVFQVGRDEDAKEPWNPIPPGWFSDLVYYSANNHPFHGMFCCDWYHPLSWMERVMMELATCGFALLTLWAEHEWVEEDHFPQLALLKNPLLFSLVVVTIPGLILWWSLFLLWTGPCFIRNAALVHKERRKGLFLRRCSLEIFGYIVVIPLIAWIFLVPYDEVEDLSRLWSGVILSRIRAYFIHSLLHVGVYFNPFLAWGQPDPKGAFVLGDLIGLGQWRIEKQKFKAIMLHGQTALEGASSTQLRRLSVVE